MILNIYFSIILIRQSRGGKKKFRGANYRKSTIFQNLRGATAPLVYIMDLPVHTGLYKDSV
jgi:hypothetical protein